MIQEFTQSLGAPSNSVAKRALDVFFDALDRFEQTAKSSNLVCGITKQKGSKDICGCNKGYCWRRCHGGVGIISFGIGYVAPRKVHQSGVTSTISKGLSFCSGSEYQTCTKDSDCVFDNTNCAKNYCALF
ncbi:hypothetical protein K493DRAFT_306418 [Basidiobolus meristosporus CBS 931.73]|uniref:Uncharacterized protein n=1 Tax=Basidiobolus meristosporus CBS 931.73 TaxID=1314790 RepID=A0A1Y1XT54_9FUNG|nr:hypothetical protein K493DRAFT_306418 [Basidiobolus meristosporus CBS 931.73]|eukprot:ORX88686.1 hypothetical protein K493DRAFT_306418 [Basidiobolus meristosporus CBS 931.73]